MATACNHILGLSASKGSQAVLINSKIKSSEPTKRDRFKKIVAVSKELQLYFQLKGDGGSSPPFSAICMFPSKNFTLVNGLNDKEESGQPPGYPVPFPAGFLGTSKHLAGSLLLLLSRKWLQDCLYHKHVERSLLGLPQPLPARCHSASPSICQCR